MIRLIDLPSFFGVEREELYSDKAIEAVIVEKNKTMFKAHRWLIALGNICLTVVIALVLTIVIKNLHDNVRSGTEVGKMIGVRGDIYEYNEDAECADYTRKLTNSQTTFANDVFNIELISKDEKPFYGIPSYYLTVKAKCQFGSVVIGVQNFYECLVISAI